MTENKLSDVSDLTISEFDSRLGGNVDNDIAIHNGKKYGVTLNIETLVAVYNKTALANNPARSLEEMVLANKNQQNPVYNATFGDLWYASVLYNTLLTSDIPTLVEVASDGGVKTVFDNNNSDFIDVAKVSYDFGQTLPPSMFDTKTRWVGGKGLYDYVLENKTNWFLDGPWDYSKKYTSQYGVLKTDGVTDEDTVFGIKRKDIAFDSIDKYQVNNKSWKHFKAGFLMSLNARLDRQQSKLNSAGKTKKMVASEFIKELLSVDYAYDWYKYAGKITPYKVGLDKIVTEAKKDSDSLVPELIDAIINGYANNSVRPKHHIFNGFWATYETNYNSRVFPHSISKITDGEQYAKSLSADIANYIKGAIN
ncbi:hypothetical protein [Spiroplasma endosymbiont of Stenodema calcarata]|uniref:hypothetical protein n=1 Tax=Spiroplasma endosymbiont of Stenodema calcarata TaxID=3139328 RepID=UPI003CCB4377